ncbi:MAG TPA: DNA-processing protein DprA [Solirubrobacterales bacterium]|nr:DNA-processing protein DprA [Solirubrobacterales bacterium]
MSQPSACPDCLRRSRLLAHLAPYIEKIATGAVGSRSPELLRLSNEDLAAAAAPNIASQILAEIAAAPERQLRADLAAARCWACCRHDARFPVGLRDAADAPWALIGRGDPVLLDRLEPEATVTVVGARRASSYGRGVARGLSRELTAAGLLVTSGLAFGIDACAHRGALDVGTTVAVLGCGADIAYPASHRSLWRSICERGLVLSELPPGTGAWRWTFPARNRIMAALAGMTVVIEAAQRSGSLITADLAADLGRDLGAVPGPVNSRGSAGTNDLLAGGACLIRDGQDVLDAMLGPGVRAAERSGPGLDRQLAEVLAAVERGEDSDAIAAALDLSGAEAAAALATLEALGYLSCSPIGLYARTLLAPPAI